jgi:hypothetical protein
MIDTTVEQALEHVLDWIDNLSLTLGHEVVLDHKPNCMPSRGDLRSLLPSERLNGARCDTCGQSWWASASVPDHACLTEHRMFIKQELAKLRKR